MNNLTIIGRRWFDRINGNTYFSSIGLIDGKEVTSITYEYGYGDQYVYETWKLLIEAAKLSDVEKYSNGSFESVWRYCERKGITYFATVSDVKRKKDL